MTGAARTVAVASAWGVTAGTVFAVVEAAYRTPHPWAGALLIGAIWFGGALVIVGGNS